MDDVEAADFPGAVAQARARYTSSMTRCCRGCSWSRRTSPATLRARAGDTGASLVRCLRRDPRSTRLSRPSPTDVAGSRCTDTTGPPLPVRCRCDGSSRLVAVGDLSVAEAADATGLSVSAAKSRLHRARVRLREELEDMEFATREVEAVITNTEDRADGRGASGARGHGVERAEAPALADRGRLRSGRSCSRSGARRRRPANAWLLTWCRRGGSAMGSVVTVTEVGDAQVDLGPAPAGATHVDFTFTCLDSGHLPLPRRLVGYLRRGRCWGCSPGGYSMSLDQRAEPIPLHD